MTLADLATLPEHVRQLQEQADACAELADKKATIVSAALSEKISAIEAAELIAMNGLEGA